LLSVSLIHPESSTGSHHRLPEPAAPLEDETGVDLELNARRAAPPQAPVGTPAHMMAQHHGLKVIQPLEPIVPPREQFAKELAAMQAAGQPVLAPAAATAEAVSAAAAAAAPAKAAPAPVAAKPASEKAEAMAGKKNKRKRLADEKPAEHIESTEEAEHNKPTAAGAEAGTLTGTLILPTGEKPKPEPVQPKTEKPKKLAPGEVYVDENGNVMIGE
jgi:hypothetical protein